MAAAQAHEALRVAAAHGAAARFCSECGAPAAAGAKFCSACGAPLAA
ncbi:MAG: zinc ribbon domain-containing protein [Burkholderiales bacterium]|nr:zinc ribbon domain-containing protein [Burkholderiales bacterium]